MSQVAVVNYGPERHSVELRDVAEPSLGANDVLLEVQAVGVCGSDLHMWTGDQSWEVKYPMVLGHEFSGIIREVGENWLRRLGCGGSSCQRDARGDRREEPTFTNRALQPRSESGRLRRRRRRRNDALGQGTRADLAQNA